MKITNIKNDNWFMSISITVVLRNLFNTLDKTMSYKRKKYFNKLIDVYAGTCCYV